MTSIWTREAVAEISTTPVAAAPVIDCDATKPILPGFDLWDYWPVQERDGRKATISGGVLYMLLAAPVLPDPEQRHAIARIRLMHQSPSGWRDLGPLFPDGFSPGSREWSGSAIIAGDHQRIALYFTAAGLRGETKLTFGQRLFETSAPLSVLSGAPGLGPWLPPVESVASDGNIYAREMTGGGGIGTIKAFRDPAWFCDSTDGQEYLVFAASLAQSSSPWNGAVVLARRDAGRWVLAAPLISADGVNNELERPHVVQHGNLYYCFWSTQRKVFAIGGPTGPNGLYGMVAETMAGPWRPLNRTGLVFANPPDRPIQAYSWFVLGDLSVISFIDRPGLSGETSDPVLARRHFGGTPAAGLRLRLDADRATLA